MRTLRYDLFCLFHFAACVCNADILYANFMFFFKDLDGDALKAEPLIYCHFASGIYKICLLKGFVIY